jgi:hypothetical protein
VIELALATLLTTADAALISVAQQSAPIAAGMYRARKISGDGRDLTVDSVEPRVIKLPLTGVSPRRVTVTVRLTSSVSGRGIAAGGANSFSCPNSNQPGTHSCVLVWTNPNLRDGDRLRFDIMSVPIGAALPGRSDTH